MACVSLGQVISQEISKIGWKAEFQQLGAPCNTLMFQVFAYSTQPRELLDKQTSTELENTRSSLPAEAGTSGAVPQSKIKETSSAVSPPSLFPPQPPSAPRISLSKLGTLAKGGVWSAVMLWRIPTTTPGSFFRRTATLSFLTQIDAWVQECFEKTFVNSEEKTSPGQGRAARASW